jgi:hypothetical protein
MTTVRKRLSGSAFAVILLTYVVVGPPLGALAMMTAFALAGILSGVRASGVEQHLWDLIVASYPFGVLPAFIAGTIVSMQDKANWRTVSLVGGAIGLSISIWILSVQLRSILGMDLNAASWHVFLCFTLPILTCLVPAVGCWRIARLLVPALST